LAGHRVGRGDYLAVLIRTLNDDGLAHVARIRRKGLDELRGREQRTKSRHGATVKGLRESLAEPLVARFRLQAVAIVEELEKVVLNLDRASVNVHQNRSCNAARHRDVRIAGRDIERVLAPSAPPTLFRGHRVNEQFLGGDVDQADKRGNIPDTDAKRAPNALRVVGYLNPEVTKTRTVHTLLLSLLRLGGWRKNSRSALGKVTRANLVSIRPLVLGQTMKLKPAHAAKPGDGELELEFETPGHGSLVAN